MTNDDKDLKPMIEKTECQECKALVSMNEYHTFSHCLIAKAYPDFWRSIVKDLTSKTTPQQPNGYDMDGNPIQYGFSGGSQQPSEKKALSMEDIKSIAIKATRKIKYPDGKTEYSLWLSNDEWTTIAQAIFDALPNEKKALSVEDMKKIMWDLENKLGYQPAYETIAQAIFDALPTQKALSREEILDLFQTFQLTVDEYREKDFPCIPEWNFTDLINAIHSALPARKEVKWPEKMEHGCDPNGYCDCSASDANEMRDACIAAYEEAIPAQREVRYPEKEYCGKINTALHNDNCEECKYHKLRNKLIDKMKKLNS